MIKDKKYSHAGQPMKYQSPEELQKKVDEYFENCKKKKEPITITGLALSLGFTSREALINYEKKKGYEKFFDIVKKAKLRVEHDYEKALRKSSKSGDIFGLKNFGWSDRQILEHTGESPIKIIVEKNGSSKKN